MKLSLHKNSRTTFKIRDEIKKSHQSIATLARHYSLDWKTVKKWRFAESVEDKTSRPRRTRTNLTEQEEEKICFLRKQFKYTIDEMYLILEDEYTKRKIYPMKIYRCLRRNGLNVLPQEFVEAERKIQKFRTYGIGYLHIDFIFTKRIHKKRYYVFTCIDRISKLAYVMLTNTHTITESVRFLGEVVCYYPYPINYILTDNGSEFSEKGYTNYQRNKTKKKHAFVERCMREKIKLRQTKFKAPWTNGMVERFNRKIKDKVITLRMFDTPQQLAEDLVEYMNRYNFSIKLKGLNYKTPVEYLQEKVSTLDNTLLVQHRTTYRY